MILSVIDIFGVFLLFQVLTDYWISNIRIHQFFQFNSIEIQKKIERAPFEWPQEKYLVNV